VPSSRLRLLTTQNAVEYSGKEYNEEEEDVGLTFLAKKSKSNN
jgi:hypothetical protein